MAGKGESMLGQSGRIGLTRKRGGKERISLASSDDAARGIYALGQFLEGTLLRG
jgi:hypothetical protein